MVLGLNDETRQLSELFDGGALFVDILAAASLLLLDESDIDDCAGCLFLLLLLLLLPPLGCLEDSGLWKTVI